MPLNAVVSIHFRLPIGISALSATKPFASTSCNRIYMYIYAYMYVQCVGCNFLLSQHICWFRFVLALQELSVYLRCGVRVCSSRCGCCSMSWNLMTFFLIATDSFTISTSAMKFRRANTDTSVKQNKETQLMLIKIRLGERLLFEPVFFFLQ